MQLGTLYKNVPRYSVDAVNFFHTLSRSALVTGADESSGMGRYVRLKAVSYISILRPGLALQ